jgi:hypothetical protein
MPLTNFSRQWSYAYLLAVPVLVTAMAFIVGHVHYSLYLPFWLLNAGLMILATRRLAQPHDRSLRMAAWLFVVPWMLIAVFGGMGPPPETAIGWAALAGEQVARYTILIISGLLTCLGFFRLNLIFAHSPGSTFSRTGRWMMGIALPLFVLNMAYWGYFQTHMFVASTLPGAVKPAWLKPLSDVFTVIRMIEVALIYLATAAFALAFRRIGWLSKAGSRAYILLACLGAILNLLPETVAGPLAIANYLSYIPAFTLLMPYLIAVNLLHKPANSLRHVPG